MPAKEKNQSRIHKSISDTEESSVGSNAEECDPCVDCGVEIFNNEKVAEKKKTNVEVARYILKMKWNVRYAKHDFMASILT